jgi:hypothetical protein
MIASPTHKGHVGGVGGSNLYSVIRRRQEPSDRALYAFEVLIRDQHCVRDLDRIIVRDFKTRVRAILRQDTFLVQALLQ